MYERHANQDQLSKESKEITFWLANEKLRRRSNMHLAVMRQNWEFFEVENQDILNWGYLSLKIDIVHECTDNENKDY